MGLYKRQRQKRIRQRGKRERDKGKRHVESTACERNNIKKLKMEKEEDERINVVRKLKKER